MWREFAGDTPATTLKAQGAVSSVVERLVYTDGRMVFSIIRTRSDMPNARQIAKLALSSGAQNILKFFHRWIKRWIKHLITFRAYDAS
jgi:hypothetical protein